MFWALILTNVPELLGFLAVAGLFFYGGYRWGRRRERKSHGL